jgi:hypothetical protein
MQVVARDDDYDRACPPVDDRADGSSQTPVRDLAVAVVAPAVAAGTRCSAPG